MSFHPGFALGFWILCSSKTAESNRLTSNGCEVRSRKTCRPAVATKTVVSREADIQRVSVESPIFTKVIAMHLTNCIYVCLMLRPTTQHLPHLRLSGKPLPFDCIGCHVGWKKDFSGFTFDFAHRFLLQPIRTHSILSTFLCFPF